MLKHIQIQNFTIIENISLELHAPGMTVLTGETGAGKSILIDALALVLGGRGDNKVIRHGSQKCDITAIFDIHAIPQAKSWLRQQELNTDEHECLLRRTISQEGPSRGYINGQPVPLQLLRELGDLLVDIHGQHEHQSLLKRDMQRQLLDDYAGHSDLVHKVQMTYQQWCATQQELLTLQTRIKDQAARSDFLRFQVQELSQLNLTVDELAKLDKEHKQLANMDETIEHCQRALIALEEQDNPSALSLLKQAQIVLSSLKQKDNILSSSIELLDSSIIQVQEVLTELNRYLTRLELNPERLKEIEQRIAEIHVIARKHRLNPAELPPLLLQMTAELDQLDNSDSYLKSLSETVTALEADYFKVATQLSLSRKKTAKKLSQLVQASMQQLGMPGGRFDISLEPNKEDKLSASGLERIDFMVSANPGQPLQFLAKIASGGELSRISLAIQVITAQSNVTPTLIFDEVDVGIGGGTAAIVGQLLRQLGQNAQVLCVTHLPQVAAQGQQHFQVLKSTENNQTHTQIRLLTGDEKVQEIARMLGGVKITAQTLAHAREMLEV